MRQSLTDNFRVDVTRIPGVHELVVIALGFQHACKALIRDQPIAPIGRGGFCADIVFRNITIMPLKYVNSLAAVLWKNTFSRMAECNFSGS